MPNFSTALTGLQADTVSLNTIGNNLANLNTTAFKEQTTTFEDLFYQQIGTSGSNNPLQVGVGTRVSGTATDFLQGSLATTGNSTDMALQGNGFFVVQQGGVQSLTRAGNFQLDSAGNMTTVNGEQVMGYPATWRSGGCEFRAGSAVDSGWRQRSATGYAELCNNGEPGRIRGDGDTGHESGDDL